MPAGARRRRVLHAVVATVVAMALLGAAPNAAKSSAKARSGAPPAVIAVVERGINVLHRDFAVPGGGDATLPPGLPAVQTVTLPASGSFNARVDQARSGPLGNLESGTLYYVRGTRVLVYSPDESLTSNVFDDRSHGTGVASAAVGLEYGTNPDALVVVVVDSGPEAWAWMADQDWIDAVSTSYITILRGTERCHEAPYIRQMVNKGRMVFSAVGNGEQLGELGSPSGVPESYQVGGVDAEGRPYLPSSDGYASTSNRPYETGDRFEFEAADADALSGPMAFGGTSGATPSTAGRATELIEYARSLLRSEFTGQRGGLLAQRTGKSRVPRRGPLADGDLTNLELTDLLHHIAVPAEPAVPGRYFIEGFGALNHDEAMTLGKRILAGNAEMPERPNEEAAHEVVEAARAASFPEGRCT